MRLFSRRLISREKKKKREENDLALDSIPRARHELLCRRRADLLKCGSSRAHDWPKKAQTRLDCDAERFSSSRRRRRHRCPFFFFTVGAVFDVADDIFPASFLNSNPYLFDLDEVRVVELELALGSLWINGDFAK